MSYKIIIPDVITIILPYYFFRILEGIIGRDNAMELAYIRTYLHHMSDEELIKELVKDKYKYLLEEAYKKYYR